MISKIFSSKLTQEQLNKVVSVCAQIEIPVNALLAVMYFETAKTFSPSKRNTIGSVGLIQFTRDIAGVQYKTIANKKYYLDDLAKMSFVEQMDIVKLYFMPAKGKLNTFIDVYLYVFFPIAVGKGLDFVFETSRLTSSLIAKQNPIFDTNKDGKITKNEVLTFFSGYYGSFFSEITQTIDWKKISQYLVSYVALPVALFFYTFLSLSVINS